MAQIKELVSGERLDQDLKMGNGEGDLSCIFGYGVQTISAAAAITLVVGKAAAGQTQLKSNVLVITNATTNNTVITLALPAAADWKGVPLMILNVTVDDGVSSSSGSDNKIVRLTGLNTADTLDLAPIAAAHTGAGSSAVVVSTGTLILEVA